MSIGLASLAVSIGLVGYMYYEKYQVGTDGKLEFVLEELAWHIPTEQIYLKLIC